MGGFCNFWYNKPIIFRAKLSNFHKKACYQLTLSTTFSETKTNYQTKIDLKSILIE